MFNPGTGAKRWIFAEFRRAPSLKHLYLCRADGGREDLMDERTWMKWGVILGGMLGAVTARGDMTVRKIVFQGRGVARPEVQLVVSSGGDGYSAQLWKGDYLWSDCRQARHSTGRLNFVCGSQEVRLEPPARAVLLRPQGDSVDHEELEVLTAAI